MHCAKHLDALLCALHLSASAGKWGSSSIADTEGHTDANAERDRNADADPNCDTATDVNAAWASPA
jgi:hypothetical protein